MDHSDVELNILRIAATSGLPQLLGDDSVAPISSIAELVDDGCLNGRPIIAESQIAGFQFLTITAKGRRRIDQIEAERKSRTFIGKLKAFAPPLMWMLVGSALTILTDWIRQLIFS